MEWDEKSGFVTIPDWNTPATLNTYLNTEYLNSFSDLDIIVDGTFSVGKAISSKNLDLTISNEKKSIWKGKIGLITISEYLRSNSKIQNCENWESYNTYRTYCKETSWIYSLIPSNGYISTLSPANEGNIYSIYKDTASISYYSASAKGSYVFPVLYLTSDVTLSGTGTEKDPYVITN